MDSLYHILLHVHTADSNWSSAALKKGVICFHLGEYESSRKWLLELKGKIAVADPLHTQVDMWLRKCALEISGDKLVVGPAAQAVKGAPVNSSTTVPTTTSTTTPPLTSNIKAAPSTTATPIALPSSSKIKPEFYQTPSVVNLSLLGARGLAKEVVNIEFTEREVDVQINLGGGNTYTLNLVLYDKIIPSESSWTLFSSKIEIKMKKAVSYHWPSFEGVLGSESEVTIVPAVAVAAAATTTTTTTSAVSAATAPLVSDQESGGRGTKALPSAYATKKNWDAIEKEVNEELEKEKPEGEEALQQLFRQIYKNADEDTRRAMNKSFQTSNGTVLSTNWKEVKEKDYEKEDKVVPDGFKADK